MEHNILTLDFRLDSVAYEGNIMPTGTLGCEVLNIDDETIRTLESPCAVMGKLTEALGYGTADDDLLSEAKSAANQILDVLRNVAPFNRLDYDFYVPGITNAFTPEGLRQYRAYNLALLSGTLTAQQADAFKTGILLARITMAFAQLAESLRKYRDEIMPFAQTLDADESDRTPDGLSALFGRFFPPESPLEQDSAWMAFTNATVQYISVVYPNEETAKLVKRMHFVSFVGLFRSDLFEGLSIGHAPKRCRICGKWFLTTNARHTKYCGGFAPADKYHRTCRQIGNLKGREQRELADDHPIRQIYATRTNETADDLLTVAQLNRNIVPLYCTWQDEDSEETGEDVTCDDRWDYAEILWDGIRAEKIQRAFDRLDYREQTILEKRLAICMTCGRVGDWKNRATFEKLAVMFEGSTSGGAERAYRKAIEHLTEHLINMGVLHAVRIKQKSKISRKGKIIAATYAYRVDFDGEWGEIKIDFQKGEATIVQLAELDTVKTNCFARRVIAYLQKCENENEILPREMLIPFED